MPSKRCPRAAARVSVAPDISAKSALPEITALAEPMPAIMTLLTFSPCLANRPEIFREIAGREGERDIGHRQHHVLRAAAGLGVDRGRQQERGGEGGKTAN